MSEQREAGKPRNCNISQAFRRLPSQRLWPAVCSSHTVVTLTTAGQVVVIGSVPPGSALRAQLDAKPNTRIFPEADFLRALETIIADVPQLIAIDPEFAATARGAALVARVKTDPRLSGSEVRAFVTDPESGGFLSAPIAAEDQLSHCHTIRCRRGNEPAVCG